MKRTDRADPKPGCGRKLVARCSKCGAKWPNQRGSYRGLCGACKGHVLAIRRRVTAVLGGPGSNASHPAAAARVEALAERAALGLPLFGT